MTRGRARAGAVLAAMVAAAALAPPLGATEGRETFSGMIGTSSVSGRRHVVASVVVARGVYNGVGKVEVPNRPGDPNQLSRDELVFPEGKMRLASVTKHFSLVPDRQACTFTFTVQQTGKIEGGTGRFVHASAALGTSVVRGQGIGRRNPDGSCDMKRPLLVEIDTFAGSGTFSF